MALGTAGAARSVSASPAAASAAREAIGRLCAAGLPARELLSQVMRRLGQVIPYYRGGWSPLDPGSMVATDLVNPTASPSQLWRVFDSEYSPEADFGKYTAIASAPSPVLSLWAATGGDLRASRRYREILEPLGYGDELRAVFRSRGMPLGVLCLARSLDQPAFHRHEIGLVASVGEMIGDGLRSALAMASATDTTGSEPPGMIVLGSDDMVEGMSAEAAAWLAVLPPPASRLELPAPVYQVARRARAAAAGQAVDGPAWVRIRTVSGRWLSLHAALLPGRAGPGDGAAAGAGRVGVVIQPAARSQLLPLLTGLHGLSRRECEVTRLMLRGADTSAIAAALHISPHTVRDHIKAIFAKLGVSSRAELAALLTGAVAGSRSQAQPGILTPGTSGDRARAR